VFPKFKTLLALTVGALPLAAQAQTPPPPPPFVPFTAAEQERYLARGKQIMAWYLAGHADSVYATFAPEIAGQMDADGVRQQRDVFEERVGTVIKVVAEKMTRRNGIPQFWWEAEGTNFTPEPVVMRWMLNEQLQVVGVGFNPKSQARFDPEG
jgi:hypothetical protein